MGTDAFLKWFLAAAAVLSIVGGTLWLLCGAMLPFPRHIVRSRVDHITLGVHQIFIAAALLTMVLMFL